MKTVCLFYINKKCYALACYSSEYCKAKTNGNINYASLSEINKYKLYEKINKHN